MPSLLGLHPQSLLQSILDSVGVALAVIDRDGKFVFTNQAALKMLGATASLSGVSFEEWRRGYVFRDSLGRVIPTEEAPLLRALAGEAIDPQYVGLTLPDGRINWLHAAGHPFSVMGLHGVLVIVTDDTERVELRRAAERAQRVDAIGVLAGGLAHDFNNMLSVISENVALSLAEPDVPAAVRDRLQQMELALEKGAALARRLVQFSRAQEIETQPVQINEAVNTALELVRPLLGKRVRVKTELASNLPFVEADRTEIEQALVNLILNALDAMPEGGELALHTEAVPADAVSADKNDRTKQFVLITVADTGTGIPENLQDSIFDPFFTTKRDGKGAGLGLSSVQRIVHQHNGHIKMQSAPGKGTKFSIYLPVEEKPATMTTEAV
ncbi:MAG TPA: ATP-binding protein [Candidatus Angelobacter sp.]